MSVGKRSGLALALACLGLGLTGGTNAHAAPAEIVAADECCEFIDGLFSQPAGSRAMFRNPGQPNRASHNVSSNSRGPDGGPLFYSLLISPGATTRVRGTEYLDPGTYGFFCDLHPEMVGTLEVTGDGTATPRPRVVTRIPTQPLGRVRKTGRLVVKLRSLEAIGPVSLTVKARKRAAGDTRITSLAAGKTKLVSVSLYRSARKAIRKGGSVKFEARSVAEFGVPRKGVKVLRSGGTR